MFFFLFLFSFLLFHSSSLSASSKKLLTEEETKYLEILARDTYRCIDFYTDPETALPMDNSRFTQDAQTSITNVGLYIASVVSACEMGFEKKGSALSKMRKLFKSLKKLDKWNNFPYCWNHCKNLTKNKENFISTVDLGNYYAGIIIARQYFPELQKECDQLLSVNWNKLYDSGRKRLYGGYNTGKNSYATWHYDHLGAESRLANLLAIAMSNLSVESWEVLNRSLEERYGIEYLKPGWQGGGLFLGFLSGIFIDERGTLPYFSAANFAKAQMVHAERIQSPVWGWSASDSPNYGYLGFQAIRDDVVTPHASTLSIRLFPKEVAQNLKKLDELGVRSPNLMNGKYYDFGFRDAYDIKTEQVTQNYLILDQEMIFLSLANFLKDEIITRLFSSYPPVKAAFLKIKDYSSRLDIKEMNFPVPLSKLFNLKTFPYDIDRPEFRATFASKSPLTYPQEWEKSQNITLSTSQLEIGKVQDEKDLSATVSLLWDQEFIYIKSNVNDQSLKTGFTGSDIYKGDLVEFYINPDTQGLQWGNSKDFQIGVTPISSEGTNYTYAWFQNRTPAESEVKAFPETIESGYKIISAISWKFLGVKEAIKGKSIGFSVAINDLDDDAIENAKLNWYFKPRAGKIELGKLILQ